MYKNKLITREECQKIIKKTNAFYCIKTIVEGQSVEIYDYRLASFEDFNKNNAWELRGLCFVKNSNEEWKRNLLLEKFYSVNQTTGWMYSDLKNKKIKYVQDKLDGSIISFILFENNNILAKSKMSFRSKQAKMAQELYLQNKNLQIIIKKMIKNGLNPIFELISPENEIVVSYEKTELVLIQIRDIKGTYLEEEDLIKYSKKLNVKYSKFFENKYKNLDYLLKLKEISKEDIEGWVIVFDDLKGKIKTNSYLQKHGILGNKIIRENLIVETIIDGNIDDVYSNLLPGYKLNKLKIIEKLINIVFNSYCEDIIDKIKISKHLSRKEVALRYKNFPYFSIIMKNLNLDETSDIFEDKIEKEIKKLILQKNNSLEKSIIWIKETANQYNIPLEYNN